MLCSTPFLPRVTQTGCATSSFPFFSFPQKIRYMYIILWCAGCSGISVFPRKDQEIFSAHSHIILWNFFSKYLHPQQCRMFMGSCMGSLFARKLRKSGHLISLSVLKAWFVKLMANIVAGFKNGICYVWIKHLRPLFGRTVGVRTTMECIFSWFCWNVLMWPHLPVSTIKFVKTHSQKWRRIQDPRNFWSLHFLCC